MDLIETNQLVLNIGASNGYILSSPNTQAIFLGHNELNEFSGPNGDNTPN